MTESGADLLIYGMAEKAIIKLLKRLADGEPFSRINDLQQTVFLASDKSQIPAVGEEKILELPHHDELTNDKVLFAKTFRIWEEEISRLNPARIIQPNSTGWLVINPPAGISTEKELDEIYSPPFTRLPHPKYQKRGAIPAWEMIKHSITMHRGCFGGCSFCAISAHQGKFVSSRSQGSILLEVEQIVAMPGFKGHITDLGGPSANMYRMTPINPDICRKCKRPSCIYPKICSNLDTDHNPMIDLYRKVRTHPAIKKVTVGSGIRYDLFMNHKEDEARKRGHQKYFRELLLHHVSGRLKVAPEHTSDRVLKIMRKPSFKKFEQLKRDFDLICRQNNLNQQLVPYFISSHPGSQSEDMAQLAEITRRMGFRLEQVQDFTPTPGTLATTMYYTGLDPYTLKPLPVARSRDEKDRQRNYFFWYKDAAQKKRPQANSALKHRGAKRLKGRG
ncbi:MAG TPA: YgiQ family radical SAM protein [Bacteroidales bacterium]|nr:YgiQ family radical SAM protein [Bacteroidales bacterium]